MGLSVLHTENKKCHRCSLRSGCNQVVTGVGNVYAKMMFVGEAPGQEEDILGEPFVGRSGCLLRKLIVEAGINLDDIYITNIVKCRPPNNATPSDDHIAACKVWIWKELKILQPKVVVTLGKVPLQTLNSIKGTFTIKDYLYQPIDVDYKVIKTKLFPCYHPSFLLRNGSRLDKEMVAQLKKAKGIADD